MQCDHATTYKNNNPYVGKKVVVVGLGESGADICREISDVAASCTVGLRSLPCVFPRLPNYRSPTDGFTFRSHHYLFCREITRRCGVSYDDRFDCKALPGSRLFRVALTGALAGVTLAHAVWLYTVRGVANRLGNLLGFYPEFDSMRQSTAKKNIDLKAEMADDMGEHVDAWYRINGGKYFGFLAFYPFKFLVKNASFLPNLVDKKMTINASGVKSVSPGKVHFGNGESVEADVIVFCTGYKDRFPFFEDDALKEFPMGGVRDLYRHAIRPEVGKNLCYVGWVRPISGGVPAASEMVSRYFAALQSGRCELPADLEAKIATHKKYENTAYELSPDIKSLIVSQPQFFDSIAKDIGCMITTWKYLHDPKFLYQLWNGPFLPQLYRIEGPNAVEGSKAYIKKQEISVMTNPLPGDFFAAKFPMVATQIAIDNFFHEILGKSIVLPFLNKMMPEFDDSKYLYGFDPKKLNHFDPRKTDTAGPIMAAKAM